MSILNIWEIEKGCYFVQTVIEPIWEKYNSREMYNVYGEN